jgi:hypothetical protein
MTLTAIQTTYPYQRLVRTLFYFLILLAGMYIYFVNSIVLDVAGRQRAAAKISDQISAVALLESRYVALSSTVTLERARALGFSDVSNHTSFAYAGAALVQ